MLVKHSGQATVGLVAVSSDVDLVSLLSSSAGSAGGVPLRVFLSVYRRGGMNAEHDGTGQYSLSDVLHSSCFALKSSI
jgi:hypothetical protein